MSDQKYIQHGLETEFKTYCGLSRHFTVQVVPVARTLKEVNCLHCLQSDEYKKTLAQIQAELSAIEESQKSTPQKMED